MLKPLVVANWKMNPPTWREARKLLVATKKVAAKAKVSLVVAPPSLYLRELAKGSRNRITFAAQNAHAGPDGAHTGEISMAQARDSGASYVLVGHSEVRASGETDEKTRVEVAAALSARLKPILCVGEKMRTQSGGHFGFVAEQLKAGFADVPVTKISDVIVAYEPVWVIGGEQTMSPRDMHEMAIFIRKTIVEAKGEKGLSVRILYGGSATEENSAAMLRDGDVSGLLVGHVSIDAPRFSALLRAL